ncbi:hypothetical protein, partial [Nocardia gamkensis]
EENPKVHAEVLFELATSDDERLNKIAGENVGDLYDADPELGRALWELMVTTDKTYRWAGEMVQVYIYDREPRTLREQEDFAAIDRLFLEWLRR